MNLVFFGTPDFAAVSLRRLTAEKTFRVSLVVSQPNRKVGRHQVVTAPAVARLAQERGIPLLQPERVRDNRELLAKIKDVSPDALVVVAYGKILPEEILAAARLGGINLHASILPKFRGASPVAAAILAGEKETGVSVMRMTAGLDEGPVYSVRRVAIDESDDAGTLTARLASEGAGLLVETLSRLREGPVEPVPQLGEPSYCKPIRKEDGEIDWSRPAAEIIRRLRAFTPWPGIFTFLNGERIKILKAAEGTGEPSMPGTLVRLGESFAIACAGESALVPFLVQREGRRPVPVEEFARGLSAGRARFGK